MEKEKPDKFLLKTLREQQKRLKPGECMKYVRMVVDENILCTNYGSEFMESLLKTDLKFEIRNLPTEDCIIWERNCEQRVLDPNADKGLTEEWQIEEQVLKIITADDFSARIKRNNLYSLAEELLSNFPEKRYSLMVVSETGLRKCYETSTAIIELQMEYKLNCEILNLKELISQLQRFTKAIAEAPLKRQRAELHGTFKKFLANDKKQCVRVVGREGLSRLWQQHLNRMTGVTLHLTDTIMNEYSCPKKLFQAYEKYGPESEDLLADLRIKRSAQTTQNARRLGNSLSAKYYKFYTSLDPNEII